MEHILMFRLCNEFIDLSTLHRGSKWYHWNLCEWTCVWMKLLNKMYCPTINNDRMLRLELCHNLFREIQLWLLNLLLISSKEKWGIEMSFSWIHNYCHASFFFIICIENSKKQQFLLFIHLPPPKIYEYFISLSYYFQPNHL